MAGVGARPGVDFRDPGLPRRLHGAFSGLREDDPVCRLRDGFWFVTRYDDVAVLLKDRVRLGTDLHAVRGYDEARPFGAGSALERFQEGLLINLPAADHRRVRGAFTKPFTRGAVEASMGELVAREAAALLAALPDDGEVDWVAAVAQPLPARVFMALFDLPHDDMDMLLALLHQDTVAIDVLLDPAIVAAEDLARGQAAMLGLVTYLEELAVARLDAGATGDDLLSWLLRAHRDGVLSWDDVLTQAMESLAAGTSTTQTLLSGMIEAFAAFPGEWDRVAADPSLVTSAVEEALRFVSPALTMGRVVLEDFTLHGRSLRAGDVVQCAVLVANRDPAAFPEPDRFDVGRTPNRHVAFGGGVHTCLGAHVARLEAREVLERAAERWRRIEVDGDGGTLHPTLMIRTYKSLPVRLVGR
ncbi:Polyketide biosynthesis cytochrome P450 PksS [Baekduia alba]|uniref:cytochrome P450 n=1 Tax=Baekduia alba TaxID=2997333 RepID=UPI002340A5D6|nr:cytochrome P450 [Baekduia alba]WCB94605.1 Polyketide biosynthesis cytochrome P450 PksS [Baekduia alba]